MYLFSDFYHENTTVDQVSAIKELGKTSSPKGDTLMGHIKISRIDLTQFYPLNGTSVQLCLSIDISRMFVYA